MSEIQVELVKFVATYFAMTQIPVQFHLQYEHVQEVDVAIQQLVHLIHFVVLQVKCLGDLFQVLELAVNLLKFQDLLSINLVVFTSTTFLILYGPQ